MRFCEADSAALEEGYRRREEELEGAWWEEAAAAAAEAPGGKNGGGGGGGGGGAGGSITIRRVNTGDSEAASDATADANNSGDLGTEQQPDLDADDDPFAADAAGPATWADHLEPSRPPPPPGVLVRAGDWEVNLRRRRMSACYHPAPAHRVRRGSWVVVMGLAGLLRRRWREWRRW